MGSAVYTKGVVIMKVYIWLDDVRDIGSPPFDWGLSVRAHSYADAIYYLTAYLKEDNEVYISFDHDLGEEKSGYDVAKWLVENEPICKVYYRVHSMNPVGRANIERLLDHYGYERF